MNQESDDSEECPRSEVAEVAVGQGVARDKVIQNESKQERESYESWWSYQRLSRGYVPAGEFWG